MSRRLTRFVLSSAFLSLALGLFIPQTPAQVRKKRVPPGGRAAVVIDERLAALRDAPDLSSSLLQRLGRGRVLALRGSKAARDGVVFHRVGVTSRTSGWVQSDALASPGRAGDDERFLRLIRGSGGFDRVERAALFLENFPRSPHRPAALLIIGDATEAVAQRLSRDAAGRLDDGEMKAGGAPFHSYFLNYSGLDRFRRRGVGFTFDAETKQFHYDGAAWRELLRRHPHSPEAAQAKLRLASLPAVVTR